MKDVIIAGIVFFSIIFSNNIVIIQMEDVIDGKVLYVGGSGPNNYTKIQDAINDAMPRDTIFVYGGIYLENIVIDKSISLIGESRNTTIIEGIENRATIEIIANEVSVENLSIINGYATECIRGSTFHSKISNCKVYSTNKYLKGEGIFLYRSSWVTINSNYIFNVSKGVYLSQSSYNEITSNLFYDIKRAIVLNYANVNAIANNTMSNVSCDIDIYVSSYNEIVSNQFEESAVGIYLMKSKNNIIIMNKFSNITYGIHLRFSPNNSVKGNGFTSGGLFIFGENYRDYIEDIDKSNLIKNKPIYYFLNSKNTRIFGQKIGQIILINYSNFFISCSELSDVVVVGIEMVCSSLNSIELNRVYNCIYGIYLINSSNNKIFKNKIYNNNEGIFLFPFCEHNLICGNRVFKNGKGVHLVNSPNNTILHNKVYNNTDDAGIYLISSPYTRIWLNYIQKNLDNGIYVSNSNGCSIYLNRIYKNRVGIHIHSINTEVHLNNILKNMEYGILNVEKGSEYIVDASFNWWGSWTAPYPYGKGDAITQNVKYEPWLPFPVPLFLFI